VAFSATDWFSRRTISLCCWLKSSVWAASAKIASGSRRSGLDQPALDRLLGPVTLERFTKNTMTDKAALYRRLQAIREAGYGTDEEEYTIGVRCVAVPIRDQRGQVVAAMSISVPVIRFDEEIATRALTLLLDGASGLSATLGYQPARVSPVSPGGSALVG
jgi:Bacterial transcriptional regulator